MLGTSAKLGEGGGISSYTAYLCQELASAGFVPIVLAPPPAPGQSWVTYGAAAEVLLGPNDAPDTAISTVRFAVEQWRVCGVINNDHPYLQAYAPISEVPFVAVCHFDDFTIGALTKENWQYIDYIVAISSDMRQQLVQRYRIPIARIQLIHTGVPSLPEITHGDQARSGAVYLGGGNPRKGADMTERLVARLAAHDYGERLSWFGAVPSPMRQRLQRFHRIVELMGEKPRSEVLSALSRARYLLFPSRREGCPMALLEAMAHGTIPICANGRGAMKEIVRHGENGYLFELNTWTSAAQQILVDPAAATSLLSKNAQNTIMQSFTMKSVASQLVELLMRPTIVRPAGTRYRPIQWHRLVRRGALGLIDRARYRLGVVRRLPAQGFDTPHFGNSRAS